MAEPAPGAVKDASMLLLGSFIASNLVVLAFLYYSIHATLKDNEEEVANSGSKVKASELTRASVVSR